MTGIDPRCLINPYDNSCLPQPVASSQGPKPAEKQPVDASPKTETPALLTSAAQQITVPFSDYSRYSERYQGLSVVEVRYPSNGKGLEYYQAFLEIADARLFKAVPSEKDAGIVLDA